LKNSRIFCRKSLFKTIEEHERSSALGGMGSRRAIEWEKSARI